MLSHLRSVYKRLMNEAKTEKEEEEKEEEAADVGISEKDCRSRTSTRIGG